MKQLLINALLGLASLSIVLVPQTAQASYEDAWNFVCYWDCGEAYFEPEYGGYTIHGYSSTFYNELPSSESEAAEWAYYDYWVPAGCGGFSTSFSQTVCLDTAFFQGVSAWRHFSRLYWDDSDDVLACKVIAERAASRDPNAPYAVGWRNRDRALADLGNCSI
jgi:hypothetical protein